MQESQILFVAIVPSMQAERCDDKNDIIFHLPKVTIDHSYLVTQITNKGLQTLN